MPQQRHLKFNDRSCSAGHSAPSPTRESADPTQSQAPIHSGCAATDRSAQHGLHATTNADSFSLRGSGRASHVDLKAKLIISLMGAAVYESSERAPVAGTTNRLPKITYVHS